MKHLKKITLLLIVLLLFSCSSDTQTSSLSCDLKVGETYTIKVNRAVKNYVNFNNTIQNINDTYSTGFSLTPKSVTPSGGLMVAGKIVYLDFKQEGKLGLLEFNSTADSTNLTLFTKPFAKILNKEFLFEIKKDGSVLSLTGLNKIIENALSGYEKYKDEIRNPIRDILFDNFSDEPTYELFKRMFAFYPGKDVDIYESWQKSFTIKNQLPLIVNANYTLLERNNGVAIIEIKSDVNTDTSKVKNPAYKLIGTQEGKFQVDEISGWISKAHFSYQLQSIKNDTLKNLGEELISSEMQITYEPLSSDAFREIIWNPNAVLKGDGIGMTITGMAVVFASLVFLYIIFNYLSSILKLKSKFTKKTPEKSHTETGAQSDDDMSAETNAAIAMALYLYTQELHDAENTVLTINKVSRSYSPWSSKIYGLRQHPRYK